MVSILDRRQNPKDKNLGNRQRFLARNKKVIIESVRKATAEGGTMTDIGKNGKQITIPSGGTREPVFRRDPKTGSTDMVLPGNKEFRVGDLIHRPQDSEASGGKEGSADGEGEDAFTFGLSRDELLDIYFEDLELPSLVRKILGPVEEVKSRRAGVSHTGTPNNLDLVRTARQSYGRHAALGRPKRHELDELKEKIAEIAKNDPDNTELSVLKKQLEGMERRRKIVPYMDPIDLRYRAFEKKPEPVAQAVMFCLMDVSGSMGEHEKYIGKLFFTLLHLFLRRAYERIEIVFIRHTQHAKEVDEDTFFNSRETGGTIVSSALKEMLSIVKGRYSPDAWNIYVAEASDGDNESRDNATVVRLLTEEILPIVQYFAYLEVLGEGESILTASSKLWDACLPFAKTNPHFVMRRVAEAKQVYPVFRDLFEKKQKKGIAA